MFEFGSIALARFPFSDLATLEKSVITGRIGNAPADWLTAQKATFFGVFGFEA